MTKHLKVLAADNRQASAMVINGLGQLGLLDRISTDGSWWIHHARTEQFAVVQDGLLKSLRLTHTGASSFFILPQSCQTSHLPSGSDDCHAQTPVGTILSPTDAQPKGSPQPIRQPVWHHDPAAEGRFSLPSGGPPYELLVFDCAGQLIVPLNDWYLLMRGVGAARTRDTYLAVLRPWFGFFAEHQFVWNTGPAAVRQYTREFLLDAGCALPSGRIEGWSVQATNKSPISTGGLHLLVAALRNFYEVMRRGVFDTNDHQLHPLYPYENPMYSRTLPAWRREHRKWIRNSGAPEYAGIRSESRADSVRQPLGFFRVRRQPLEPPVARDAELTRLVILAGVHY